MQRRAWRECPLLPRTGSSLIAVAPVLRPSCMPHRPMAPLAVKLIAGHGAGGGRRGPRPGRCDQVPNLGMSSRTAGDAGSRPWIIQRTGPVRRPGPGNVTARPAAVQFAGTWQDVAARSARALSWRHAER